MGATASRGDGDPTALELAARPVWQDGDACAACARCSAPFSRRRRRHHCRSCGGCFCADCTPRAKRLPLLGYHSAVRVCGPCSEETAEGDWGTAVASFQTPSAQQHPAGGQIEEPMPPEPDSPFGFSGRMRDSPRLRNSSPRWSAAHRLAIAAVPSRVHRALDADAGLLFGPREAAGEQRATCTTDELLAVPLDDVLRRHPAFASMLGSVTVTEAKRAQVRKFWGPNAPRWLRDEMEHARRLGAFSAPPPPAPPRSPPGPPALSPSSQGMTSAHSSHHHNEAARVAQ